MLIPPMMLSSHTTLTFVVTVIALAFSSSADEPTSQNAAPKNGSEQRASPLVLAHYMPWYTITKPPKAKPKSLATNHPLAPIRWGWHWTMDHFDPNQQVNGQRQIASHFYPTIGPYDSGDPDVLEYHLLLMKLSGIDGVIVDWYGLSDFRDYKALHENTKRLVDHAGRLNMKFAICYEDQTIPALIEARRIEKSGAVGHAVKELNWLGNQWFVLPDYVRLQDKPVLLSFGHAGLSNDQWSQALTQIERPVQYFAEHFRRPGGTGAFDWPVPQQGIKASERFYEDAKRWPNFIPVAYPRFIDIYAQAKLHDGYGTVPDQKGKTFRDTFRRALESDAPIIQLATWNDWGEGTQLEPSVEFGTRDLRWIQQQLHRSFDARFQPKPDDLKLPLSIYRKRKQNADQERLDSIVDRIVEGDLPRARLELSKLPSTK